MKTANTIGTRDTLVSNSTAYSALVNAPADTNRPVLVLKEALAVYARLVRHT